MSSYPILTDLPLPEAPAPEFDARTQTAFAARFRTCPPEAFLGQLERYVPRDTSQRTVHELYRGWAIYDAGRYLDARPHLIQALRRSAAGSAHRSLLRGLLGEIYLRTGQFLRAERSSRRALAEGCREDEERQFEAGHLFALARIHRWLGYLSLAHDTFVEALEAAGAGRFRLLILNELAELHLLRGEFEDCDRTLRECRSDSNFLDERGQGWVVSMTECALAIATGDVDRARQVADRSTLEHFPHAGERVGLLLTTMRAMADAVGGQPHKAEVLLQSVLQRTEVGGTHSDAVAAAARVLAEVLKEQGRWDEAIAAARLAARAGCFDDRIEWVRALRIEGECQWAKGEREPALRAFRKAASLHAGTQFSAERSTLARTLEQLGCAEIVPGLQSSKRSSRDPASAGKDTRLTLASGQVFVSSDRRLIESIGFAARTDLPVLIEGETGTGKELVARLIHEMGARPERPWVVLDCSTLPESLADAELFGARRGAYTGSVSERGGLLAEADGGTLFLDELAELPPTIQAKLLRVLQDGSYRRVGEDRTRRVQVRVVAATNRSAQSEIELGRLKPDLFYRLCGHHLFLTPLRARRPEVGPLAREFAQRFGGVELTSDALEWLSAQPWPGNVRQLEMLIRLAASANRGRSRLDRRELEPLMRQLGNGNGNGSAAAGTPGDLGTKRREGERAALQRVLGQNGGVVRDAARQLGISRQALYKAMRRTGLAPARAGRAS